MSRSRFRLSFIRFARLAFGVVLLCESTLAIGQDGTAQHTIVPAYERFRIDKLSEIDAGRLLISELNCQSCHGKLLGDTLPQRQAPILTGAGSRITPEHLREFITNPHAVKPGTAMPHILKTSDNKDIAEALTHFLSDGGATIQSPVSTDAINRGKKLFRTVGCSACHGDIEQVAGERPAYAMPIGQPDQKYTVTSLSQFLTNPHAVRPSGRMPSLNLTEKESRDVASYLLKDIEVAPNLSFEVFKGRWDTLPDFELLTPESTGVGSNFDIHVTAMKERFALRFSAFVHIPKAGRWKFWIGSDDGSRLLIDDKELLKADGIHPHSTITGEIELSAGPHPVVVEYFEAGGEESLKVEIAGPDVPRQPLAGLVSKTEVTPETTHGFHTSAALVKQGRDHFVKLGCASCHQHDAVKDIKSSPAEVPQFAQLELAAGCLSESPSAAAPTFSLTEQQRTDIAAAIRVLRAPAKENASEQTAERQIAETMLTLNCYACHQRNKFGGVPREQNELFTGSIREMGDEGRIPPHLDGIGDKLQSRWLKEVMNNGAKDRPYMATRMPKFGEQNVGKLIELFAAVDEKNEVAAVEFVDPDHRVIAEARLMIGDKALSCIKCHYFGKHKATGIQSLDMTTMTKRLRRDWFHRYLVNPQAYRPGTRMPGAWPNNRTVVPKILHGDSQQQIEAIWKYLSAGNKAKLPSGLIAKVIELKPTDRPLIYRNFIEGLSARGIAVGYPEQAHIAWDAEQMNLRLIWHGAFMDASLHWTGRGQGFQSPLGDHVLELTEGQPLATLESATATWPAGSARDAGYTFDGYDLNDAGRPSFRYSWRGISVADFVEPIPGKPDASLRRTITLSADKPVQNLTFRVAAGSQIEEQDGGWLIDNAVLVKFDSVTPTLRSVNGQRELLVPISFDATNTAAFRYQLTW